MLHQFFQKNWVFLINVCQELMIILSLIHKLSITCMGLLLRRFCAIFAKYPAEVKFKVSPSTIAKRRFKYGNSFASGESSISLSSEMDSPSHSKLTSSSSCFTSSFSVSFFKSLVLLKNSEMISRLSELRISEHVKGNLGDYLRANVGLMNFYL